MRKIYKMLLINMLALLSVSCAVAQTSADAVIAEARKYIGTPYRAAGRTPKGFDCSGFTHAMCTAISATTCRARLQGSIITDVV